VKLDFDSYIFATEEISCSIYFTCKDLFNEWAEEMDTHHKNLNQLYSRSYISPESAASSCFHSNNGVEGKKWREECGEHD
jgi:hypothetical protein